MNDRRRRSQAGFTLVELIIATALGALVLGALTSLVLTTAMGTNVALGRMDAGNSIRAFQVAALDDVAVSTVPSPSGCGTQSSPCTTQPMQLTGQRFNPVTQTVSPSSVTYTWDSGQKSVTRAVSGAGTNVLASDVSSYSWYVDSSGAHPSVVVQITVTKVTYNATIVQSQTLRFNPELS